MILIAFLLIVAILIGVFIVLILEEKSAKKAGIPQATLDEYWNGTERRRATRINASIVVRYNIKNHAAKVNGCVKDVSASGMGLLVNERLSDGTLLGLEFELPGLKNALYADGRVVWSKGDFADRDAQGRRVFRTGIQFVNVEPTTKSRLDSFIEDYLGAAQAKVNPVRNNGFSNGVNGQTCEP